MPSLLDKLKEYFETTPREKIIQDWESTKKFDDVGPILETKFEVGQKVYCSEYERIGVITEISSWKYDDYPILVYFKDFGNEYYTLNGELLMFCGVKLSIPITDKINKLLDL